MTLDVGPIAVAGAIEEHVGVAAWSALAGEWAALFARCPAATPFAHPAWLVPWARHLATGTPLVLAVRRGARLDALVALQLRPDGSVELAGAPVSDYRDALLADDADAGDAWLLADGALRRAPAGRASFADLPSWSALLRAPSPHDCSDAIARHAICPLVTVPRDGALADVVSARLGEDLERFRRRLARRGTLAVHAACADDCEEWLERLIALHAARWRTRGDDGVLAEPRVRRFHREVARGFAAAGMLMLTALTVDDAPAAVIYGFRRGARFYSYLSGFSPALARYSIGSVGLAAALERALADGAREIDFLRGAEPYKYRWGARDRATFCRTLVREPSCAP